MKVNGSSGATAAVRASSSAPSRPRPRSRTSCSAIASAVSPAGSITTIVRSSGRRSRTARIFATWAASSQITATDSELPATHSHSSGELVG
jgi:hypothetical protein